MAAQVQENSDILRFNPRFVNGFRAALRLLDRGELDVASSWHHNAYEAQNELGGFAEGGEIGPLDHGVRATLPVMHQGYWFCGTYADRDDLNDISDLEGMTVGLNVPGAGVTVWGRQIFEIMGIADSITFEHLSLGDVGTALQSRQVDAAFQLAVNGTTLTSGEAQAWEQIEMKALDYPDSAVEQMSEENELVVFAELNNADLNVKGAFDTVTCFLLASGQFTTAEHDADLVYEMVKTLIENQDALAQYHGAMEVWGIGEGRHNFQGVPEGTIYHEGAVRYYEENDIEFPGQ